MGIESQTRGSEKSGVVAQPAIRSAKRAKTIHVLFIFSSLIEEFQNEVLWIIYIKLKFYYVKHLL